MKLLFSHDANSLVIHSLNEIHQRTVDFPDQRAFLIVPERTKVQMERDYLETTGANGLMMAEVLSFRRLAHRLLDEAGLLPARPLDSFGRQMLLFRLMKENSSRLRAFDRLADRSGFISQTESVLGDLKRHRITSEQLMSVAQSDTAKALQDKCHDLSILLEGFDQSLSDLSLADADDDLNRLAGLLDTLADQPREPGVSPQDAHTLAHPLSKTHVTVSGFGFTRDFTPQEHRILARLDELCASLTVAIQADALPESDIAAEQGPGHYLMARRTLYRLAGRFPGARYQRVRPAYTPLQERIATILNAPKVPEALPADPTGENADRVTLVVLPSASDEVDWVAGEIRRLTQEGRYRYQDIAIALCDPACALPLLRTAGRRYRLPLFLDEARSLEGTALFRFVMGLCDLALRNWSRDAVMTVLRSGLTPLSASEADQLENDLLERGLFRKDRLFGFARSVASGERVAATQADLRVAQTVEQLFIPMNQLTEALRHSPSATHSCQLIRQYFSGQHITERIRELVSQLSQKGEMDAAVLLASAHRSLGQLFLQLETISGPVSMSLAQLRDTIRTGLAGATVTLIPSSLDQVTVGDWRQISRQPCRVLFLIGARSDTLPPKPAPEGLLKDLDRQQLSDMLHIRLPSNARDQAFADAGTLFQLMTRATDRLVLGASGSEPADVVRLMGQAFPDHRLVTQDDRSDLENPRNNALWAAWHRSALLCGSAIPMPVGQAAGWRLLIRQIQSTAEWQARVSEQSCHPLADPARSASSLQDGCLPPGHVSPDVVAQWYAPVPSLSVSQLEKYAACPFSHLAAYILGLQERVGYAPEATDTGTVLHRVIELAFREVAQSLANLPDDPIARAAWIENFIRRTLTDRHVGWLDEAIVKNGLSVLKDPGYRSRVGRKLSLMAVASVEAALRQLTAEGYAPRFLEWRFGPEQPCDFAIRIPEGSLLNLRGTIDRIDLRLEDGQTRFRIIDYKSGNATVDPDRLYHGLDLQLPVYIAAFSKNHPDTVAEEAAYFHFDRPIYRLDRAGKSPDDLLSFHEKHFQLRKTGLSQDALALAARHAVRQSETLSSNLFDGCFEVAPRRVRGGDAACRYCAFSAVCGFNRVDFHYLNPVTRIAVSEGGRPNRRQAFVRLLEQQTPGSETAPRPSALIPDREDEA